MGYHCVLHKIKIEVRALIEQFPGKSKTFFRLLDRWVAHGESSRILTQENADNSCFKKSWTKIFLLRFFMKSSKADFRLDVIE